MLPVQLVVQQPGVIRLAGAGAGEHEVQRGTPFGGALHLIERLEAQGIGKELGQPGGFAGAAGPEQEEPPGWRLQKSRCTAAIFVADLEFSMPVGGCGSAHPAGKRLSSPRFPQEAAPSRANGIRLYHKFQDQYPLTGVGRLAKVLRPSAVSWGHLRVQSFFLASKIMRVSPNHSHDV